MPRLLRLLYIDGPGIFRRALLDLTTGSSRAIVNARRPRLGQFPGIQGRSGPARGCSHGLDRRPPPRTPLAVGSTNLVRGKAVRLGVRLG